MSLQNQLDGLEMMIADEQQTINRLEAQLNDLDEKRKAAQELKTYAQEVLSKPVVLDGNGNSWANARYDLSKAEEVLSKVADRYGPVEENLRRCKVRLENLLAQKKAFPLDQLREERRTQKLRARLANSY